MMIASRRKPGFRIGASFRVAFSEDGRYLASLGKRSNIWDVKARKRCGTTKPFSYESKVDISPDSERIVIKNTLGEVAVYDIGLTTEHLKLSGKPYGEGDDVRFSSDGNFIVDSSWREDFVVRDSMTGEVAWKSEIPARNVTCRRDRLVWIFTTEDGLGLQRWPFWENPPTIYEYPHDRWNWSIASFALADTSDRVAVGMSATVQTWILDSSTGRAAIASTWATAISGTGDALDWHPSEKFIAHAGGRFASILTADLAPVWHEQFEYPSDVRFSVDGSLLAVGDWSKGAVFALTE